MICKGKYLDNNNRNLMDWKDQSFAFPPCFWSVLWNSARGLVEGPSGITSTSLMVLRRLFDCGKAYGRQDSLLADSWYRIPTLPPVGCTVFGKFRALTSLVPSSASWWWSEYLETISQGGPDDLVTKFRLNAWEIYQAHSKGDTTVTVTVTVIILEDTEWSGVQSRSNSKRIDPRH